MAHFITEGCTGCGVCEIKCVGCRMCQDICIKEAIFVPKMSVPSS